VASALAARLSGLVLTVIGNTPVITLLFWGQGFVGVQ
jgi:hypothetical protein